MIEQAPQDKHIPQGKHVPQVELVTLVEPVHYPHLKGVEIVPARTPGVRGYASLARGTGLGNPYIVGSGSAFETPSDCVAAFWRLFYSSLGTEFRIRALALLDRPWPTELVRIACPCNGRFKDQPCHASVIADFIVRELKHGYNLRLQEMLR